MYACGGVPVEFFLPKLAPVRTVTVRQRVPSRHVAAAARLPCGDAAARPPCGRAPTPPPIHLG